MSPHLKTLSEIDLTHKHVLLRVDFNVPIDADGQVGDLFRIEAVIPTILYLHERGAKVAIISHLGRPNGQPNPTYSLKPLVPVLEKLIPSMKCIFKDTYVGQSRDAFWVNLPQNSFFLCENIRFQAGEEKNDPALSKSLAQLADLFVNDAFAASHRAHASVSGVAEFIPAAPGLLLAHEIAMLDQHISNAKRPFMAVIGGAKISSKIDILNALLGHVDIMAIGGAMANTFLMAQGYEIGKSLVEPSCVDMAKDIIKKAIEQKKKLLLPCDVVTATELKRNTSTHIRAIKDIQPNESIFDVGPETVKLFNEGAQHAKTLLWNGPLGAFEIEPFDRGTLDFARYVVALTQEQKLVSLTGGGDSVAALAKLNLKSGFTYVSTGGGAFLEWIEGKALPGLTALGHDAVNRKVYTA